MNDKISIIMPAYNAEKYIKYSIESVINQSYSNWELLVIDDGSKDDTIAIVEGFIKNNKNIYLIKNEVNMGVSATRNKGIDRASGNWIGFLDSDDIWDIYKLEKQIETAKAQSAKFVFSGVSYINEKGIPYPGTFEVPKTVDFNELKKHNVISCSSVILKKELLGEIRMENDDMHEDYAFWLRILKLGEVALGINEPLLIYRISRKSKSGNKVKTIAMTYKVYRFIGLPKIQSVYFMMRHIISSMYKYKKIFQTG